MILWSSCTGKLVYVSLSQMKGRDFLAASIIISTTLLVWHKVLGQMFLGEGYYYFDRTQDFLALRNGRLVADKIWGYDNLARIIFDLLPPIFKENVPLYLAFQLFVVTTLYLTFYFLLKAITKNKLLSLTATIFFLANYVG